MAEKQRASRSHIRITPDTRIRRKCMRIDPDKLERVIEIFGARSATEAIDMLLDATIAMHRSPPLQ